MGGVIDREVKGVRELVVLREYRVPIGDYIYALPAGLIDGKESIEEAARRELKEETGLDLTKVDKITPPIYSSAGLTDESVVILFGEAEGEISTDGNEYSENIDVFSFSEYDISALLKKANKPKMGIKFSARAYLVFMMLDEMRNQMVKFDPMRPEFS